MSISITDVRKTLSTLLTETFESGDRPEGTMYLDRRAGLFHSVDALSAKDASKYLVLGGTTIAAQLRHSLYYLEVIEASLQGREEQANWAESWRVQEVDSEAWEKLKTDFRVAYERVSDYLLTKESWDEVEQGFAIVVHTAYHLGAVRQMLLLLASEST